eukprot:5825844-Amphidinium_carterae.1
MVCPHNALLAVLWHVPKPLVHFALSTSSIVAATITLKLLRQDRSPENRTKEADVYSCLSSAVAAFSNALEAGTFPVLAGVAEEDAPLLNFGQLPLEQTKVQLGIAEASLYTVYSLYHVARSCSLSCTTGVTLAVEIPMLNAWHSGNWRSGIATPFSAKIERNPAYDPFMKGKTIGGIIDACTRMCAFMLAEFRGHKKEKEDCSTSSTWELLPVLCMGLAGPIAAEFLKLAQTCNPWQLC